MNYENEKVVIENQVPKNGSGLAAVSLVLGIVSLFGCWLCVFPILFSIAGLITGIISLAQKRDGKGLAIAGIITSSIGLVLGGLFGVLYILGVLLDNHM